MTENSDRLEAFNSFLAGTEKPEREPRQYVVALRGEHGERLDIWADGAFVGQEKELLFYRETVERVVEEGLTGETRTMFSRRLTYGPVAREEEGMEIVACFPHGTWQYYYLVDERYGGIDPDLLRLQRRDDDD